ncbi:SH3 domain-containing protein [Roseobacter ponti]|uniref:SH3 domain-containing protein n=1 Tax=Roseobacter ponti TaxID=1891787 RepID=A0A858SVV9_9RHOB|nr:SH3 domain-containing protein [Roseobacter ponti]QJF51621.1 SH3 domain-containing protein [Roseobacter ponti]
MTRATNFLPVIPALLLVILTLCATSTVAQAPRVERVSFDPGTSGTVIDDSIRGYQIVDYVLSVSAGQRMVVDMTTNNASSYFNVTGDGARAAVHVGSADGMHFDSTLPSGGDWVIRVYLTRNAAQRDEQADFTLSVHVGGAIHMPTDSDFADSDAGGPDYWQVTGASTLNVRRGPSTSAAVIARAHRGQVLRNLGCQTTANNRWCHVQSQNNLINGWAAGRYLTEGSAPGNVATADREPEFEVDAMGPDFWEVTRVPAGDKLNIRSGPSTRYSIVASARNGALFRNLGCRGLGAKRWCHVQTPEGKYDGWASGAFLREGAQQPSDNTPITIPSGSSVGPDLHLRGTGEMEVRWPGGCTVLYNPGGQQINAGSTCSQAQLLGSALIVKRFM